MHKDKKMKNIGKNDLCMIINVETGNVLDADKEKPQLRPIASETARFKIFRCEDSIVRQAFFMQNCALPLRKLLDFVTNFKVDSENFQVFNKIIRNVKICLDQIGKYCDNKLIGMIDFQKQFGQIKFIRQQRLKEQNFIELLTFILKICNLDNVSGKIIENRFSSMFYETMKETAVKIYEILISVCDKNSENQIHAYSFLETYKTHTNSLEISTKFILTLLSSNSTLLNSIPKPSNYLIQHYARLLKITFSSRKAHFLYFLKSICLYQNSAIKLTQEKIHEQLFANPETFAKVIIPTIVENNTISLVFRSSMGEEVVLLDNCFDGNIDPVKQLQMDYFVNMIELFANLCKNRNFTCKTSIKDWFPIEVLIEYI